MKNTTKKLHLLGGFHYKYEKKKYNFIVLRIYSNFLKFKCFNPKRGFQYGQAVEWDPKNPTPI